MSNYHNEAKVTLDALATVFFAAATVWLVLAVLYSLSVLLFIRMRARGQLGSVYDADFGRVYLFGNNNNNGEREERSCFCYRLYLPMGFLFRRFVMLSRTDEERQRQVNQIIRVMTPEERREAMEVLLFSSSSSTTTDKEKAVTKEKDSSYQKQQGLASADSEVNTTVDMEQDSSTLDGSEDSSSSRTIQPLEAANEADDDEERGTNPAVKTKSPLSCEYGDNDCNNDDEEEGPACSICLAEFDHDVAAAALEAGMALEKHDVLVSKTCTHQFHTDCILSWLERGNNTECPCCRVPMVTEDDVWATVKKQREEEQRRKSKQMKRTLVKFLFGRTRDDSQQQKAERANHDDNGEDVDVTEQSETSVGDDDDEQDISSSPTMPVPSPSPSQQQPEQDRRNSSSAGARR